MEVVEQWERYETRWEGPREGNPFCDVTLHADFSYSNRVVPVSGFYDGDGVYCVRFMPDRVGTWRYVTHSNAPALDGKRGEFTCTPPRPGNHGPVVVRDTYHFSYADGTPYVQVGTTCYAWIHQGDALEEQTLETLRAAPFNKLRMCVFPKDYLYNRNEPPCYPFERDAHGVWDFTRFHPPFFRHLEQRVGQLLELGIEADIILFHPYDRWGFATMGSEADDHYLRYVVSRLAAYRNVWWSMANEYDLMRDKTIGDWDRFFHIVQETDPYGHLRSIHNCRQFYDHGKPWVTHASIQHSELHRVPEWRAFYRKPVVVDECQYEGNIERQWGNISAREMVHRFWQGTVGGGYVGHGETYLHPEDILWWSKGGVLHGESPSRIAFLRQLLEEESHGGLEPMGPWGARQGDAFFLYYWGVHQPAEWTLDLPAGQCYQGEVINTWEMTRIPLPQPVSGKCTVRLPGKPGMALLLRATS